MVDVLTIEQLLLERINFIRLDPLGFAASMGINLNAGLPAGTISAAPKQPLAMSDLLVLTADYHGRWMLANNSFSTIGDQGSDPGDRMAFAGFNGGSAFDWAETINWDDFPSGTSVDLEALANAFLDTLLQDPVSRAILLADQANEIGVSLDQGAIGGVPGVTGYTLTQDFGASDEIFITGRVHHSQYHDGQAWVPPGGTAGVAISAGGAQTTTNAAGGYRVEVTTGQQRLVLGGIELDLAMPDHNVKVDLYNAYYLTTSHSLTVRTQVQTVALIGVADENLVALDGAGEIGLYGNAGANTLTGNSLGNILGGGRGIDTMIGGSGDDVYNVEDTGDIVIEAADGGHDTVRILQSDMFIDFRLGASSEVETIVAVTTYGARIVGNAISQLILGGDGGDTLDGGGGGDRLEGFGGNDTYIIRNETDFVNETSYVDQDSIRAAISYVMPFNVRVESLGTVDANATTAIDLTGNSYSLLIQGNAGNNTLRGGENHSQIYGLGGDDFLDGGAGGNMLDGGLGDDTYVVAGTSDLVFERPNEGTDTVLSAITYSLADRNVENLVLTGSGNTSATGNAFDNILVSNSGHNALDAGAGSDTYRFEAGWGQDTISNLRSGAEFDTIEFGTGITVADIIGRRIGDDLVLLHANGNDRITILNFFLATEHEVQQVRFANGEVLTRDDLVALTNVSGEGDDNISGTTGPDTLNGLGGNDTIHGDDGDDTIDGDSGADSLYGEGGNDHLNGGTGVDQLYGGLGDDTYIVDQTGDKVFEANNEGADTVLSSISFSLAGQFVENLTLTGTANRNATGNSLNNVLTGNSGNNTLAGGTGIDTVNWAAATSALTIVLDANGNGVVTGTGIGTDTFTGIENVIGGSQNDTITGNGLNNRLDGGLGVDQMTGGLGNDTYVVSQVGDKAFELNGEGTDTVLSAISYSLAGQFVEHLTLTGTGNTNATGNSMANILTGNVGNNLLAGGSNFDTADWEAATSALVIVLDANGNGSVSGAGIGTDSFTSIENVIGGMLDDTITGNSQANKLYGGLGNDLIDGGGGIDRLYGGLGDDTFIVDNSADKVYENINEGIDTVLSSVSFSLVGQYADNLTLTGTAATNATGNGLNNLLVGNSASNLLTGGAGQDTFVFSVGLNGTSNVDAITDFSVINDTIRLDRTVFTAFAAAGVLGSGQFKNLSLGAADADDRILYNGSSGDVFYDADGSGNAFSAIRFADIENNAVLTYADFLIA